MTQGLGIPDSTEEIQQWIEALETELAKRGESNLSDSSSITRAMNTPPAVSGLELVSNLNTVTVRWGPVGVVNVDFYEVQVASNPSFALASSYTQRNLQFTYQEGDPDTTYYARVRAKATGGSYGAWSGTLNTDTGLATFNHLNRGSATSPTDNTIDISGEALLDPFQTAGGSPGADGNLNTATGTYGNTVISATGGTVLPFTFFEYQVAASWTTGHGESAYVTISLLRNDIVIDSITADTFSVLGDYEPVAYAHTLARVPVLGLGTPDEPGVGVFTYKIELTIGQNNGGVGGAGSTGYIAVQPLEVDIQLVELRN